MATPILKDQQVQSGATLNTASGGTIDANSVMGKAYSAAPTTSGQIPIYDSGLNEWVPGDPLVQGLYADGSASEANPVLVGGWDGSNLRALKTDSSGQPYVNINGTVSVSGTTTSTPGGGTVPVELVPIVCVGSAKDQAAGVTTKAISYTPTAGNTVVIGLAFSATVSSVTVQDNNSHSLTLNTSSGKVYQFYGTAQSGATSYTVSWTTSSNVEIGITEYQNVASVNATNGVSTGTSTTPRASGTTSRNNSFIIAAVGLTVNTGLGSITPNEGNFRSSNTSETGCSLFVGDNTSTYGGSGGSTPTTTNFSVSLGTSESWNAVWLELIPILLGSAGAGTGLSVTPTGSVAVTGTFWQATQPISAASLPLPTGAAQDSTLTGGTQKTQITDGTNALGTFANYGTSPGAVKVPGVNAFVTNTVTVSGTVTVSNSFALDSSVNGILVAQGSTTSGQSGPLVQGAVTTNAPTYTTAKTDPLSLDTSGNLRVSLKDSPANTNKFLVTPDSVALPAHQSVNVDQLNGTTTDTNSGTKSGGTLRVVIATDQPQLTNKLLVTPDANATQIPGNPTSSNYSTAVINFSSSGDNTIIAGVTAQTIRIYKIQFTVAGATNVKFGDTTVTYTSGAYVLTGNGSSYSDFANGEILDKTASGKGFLINSSSAVSVQGKVWYTQS